MVTSLLVAAAAACSKPPATAEGQASAPPPTSAGATPPAASPSHPPATAPTAAAKPFPAQVPEVVARVNGEDVKKTDFDLLVRNAELSSGPIPAERRDEILRRVLDQLVTYTVLKQECATRKFTVADAELEERMKATRAQFPDEEQFKKALAARGMSLDRLRSDSRTEILIAKLMNEAVAGVQPPTDAALREFYDKNPDKFKTGEMVRASHILIRVDEKADTATKAAAKSKIDAVLKRARAGEDFAGLARENSQDGSAQAGGDLNFFGRGRMVAPFEQAAFALKPGQISDVVTTQFGYHIITVTEHRAAGAVPFEQVSPRLRQILTDQQKQQKAAAFVEELKQKSKIEVLV
jgi:peptidyl-prolyl cis-trans isomerase C